MQQKKDDRKQSERGSHSKPTPPAEDQTREAGQGDKEQNAGGPEHRGLDEHEDRNP